MKDTQHNLNFDDEISNKLKKRVTYFVKEYWDIFIENGIRTYVNIYEIFTNTGDNHPIEVNTPYYGLHNEIGFLM